MWAAPGLQKPEVAPRPATVSLPVVSSEKPSAHPRRVPAGVRYARLAGLALGLLLVAFAVREIVREIGPSDFWRWLTAGLLCAFAALQLAPWNRMADDRLWKRCYIAFCALTALFVFLMVIKTITDYRLFYAVHKKMTIPGFQGLLIFLALMQVPAVLFERKPDLLD